MSGLDSVWIPFLVTVIVILFIVSPLLFFAVLGICFAPFAAIISCLVSFQQKRDPVESFIGALIVCLFLFLPWVCLLATNLNWRHNRRLIQITYRLVLLGWGISIVILTTFAIIWTFAFAVSLMKEDGVFADAFAPYSPLLLVGYACLALAVFFWRRGYRGAAMELRDNEAPWPPESTLVPPRFMELHMVAFVWAVAAPVVLFGATYAAFRIIITAQ